MLAAVAAGLGVALGPALALVGDLHDVSMRRLSDLELNRSVWAATRRGSTSAPGIAAVLATLRAVSERVNATAPAVDA